MAMAIRLPETGAAQVDERRRRVARTRASPTPRSEAAASASIGPAKPVNPSGPVPPAVVVGDATADVGDAVVGDGDGDGGVVVGDAVGVGVTAAGGVASAGALHGPAPLALTAAVSHSYGVADSSPVTVREVAIPPVGCAVQVLDPVGRHRT
jgi:hypothetical protein